MKSKKLANKKINASTQQYLDIAEIKNDAVLLKDGTMRSVLLVSSINFALKSEDEQNASIAAYVSFLNSLDFPLQIVIQSRKLNIDAYMDNLAKRERVLANELLRAQISDYREYVKELVELGDIMSKRFYVTIPYGGAGTEKRGFYDRLTGTFTPARTITLQKKKYEEYVEMLEKRVDFVMSNLASIGLSAVRLDTQSLIELYYNTYNLDIYEQQKLVDVRKLRTS
jgi:hypothetical protein